MEQLEEKIRRKCLRRAKICLNKEKENRRKNPWYDRPQDDKYSLMFQKADRKVILCPDEAELLTTGIMMNMNPLQSAVYLGREDMVERLLGRGFDANALQGGSNRTPLQVALETGNALLAGRLIDAGADVNACDEHGITPLHRAAGLGRTEVLRWLLDRGATVDSRDNEGMTPLHWAADLGRTDVLRLLLDSGATVNSRDNVGVTPIHLAAASGNEDILGFLAACDGIDLNPVDWSGWTPIEIAAYTGRDRTVRLLTDAGAYFDPMELQRLTPVQRFADRGQAETVKPLPGKRATNTKQGNNSKEYGFQDSCTHCSACDAGKAFKRRRA